MLVGTEFGRLSVFKGIKFILRGVVLLQVCSVFRLTLRDGGPFMLCGITSSEGPGEGPLVPGVVVGASLIATVVGVGAGLGAGVAVSACPASKGVTGGLLGSCTLEAGVPSAGLGPGEEPCCG